jgi:ribosomal protein S18 acetylase RimI-like enzyme
MNHYVFKTLEIYHIPKIAQLLYDRQMVEINHYPFLDNDLCNLQSIQSNLVITFRNEKLMGIGAFIGDEMVGYLFATIESSTLNGSMAWVPYEGLAINKNESKDLVRLLYAKASEVWVNQGCLYHSLYIPLGQDNYYQALLHLGFHIEQVHAVLPMNQYQHLDTKNPIAIRQANDNDRELLGKMSRIIIDDQIQSPVYLRITDAMIQKRKKAFETLVDEDDVIVLIAEKDNQGLGYFDFEYLSNALMVPNKTIELCVAGVFEAFRGLGVGKALMNHSHELLKNKGFKYIKTDWKVSNISASNFWPKCGFKPMVYRMVRVIDKIETGVHT